MSVSGTSDVFNGEAILIADRGESLGLKDETDFLKKELQQTCENNSDLQQQLEATLSSLAEQEESVKCLQSSLFSFMLASLHAHSTASKPRDSS